MGEYLGRRSGAVIAGQRNSTLYRVPNRVGENEDSRNAGVGDLHPIYSEV